MGISAVFRTWALMPFHFWSAVFFVLGAMVGSFLNVCIHRMPLGQSIVSPPSHCPHCKYSIPWFLNVPLATWLYLRGKCANCGAPISIRYFLVESLTGLTFLGCWLAFGHQSPLLALVYCLFLAGLIAATFIDFEHFIIPDEITYGGIVVGFLCSFIVPALHGKNAPAPAMKESLWGILVGGGVIYGILRVGKWAFGRQKLELPSACKVIFTETAIVLPDQEILYEDLFYRESDTVKLEAIRVEMSDRCYQDVPIRLSPSQLKIGEEAMNPEDVAYLEATTNSLVLPREAMGLGDVKFMAAIGAFLGWHAVIFSLFLSSILGAAVGLLLIKFKHQSLQSRLPYGPYIALAAAIWIFRGHQWWAALGILR
jgi:leader peptidase (prepilin peptidase)/N-methyltransferase